MNFFDVLHRLRALKDRYHNSEVTASDVTKIIRRQFPATDFSFSTVRDYVCDYNMIVVSGTYDYENDDQLLPGIEISLSYHPEQQLIDVSALDWDRFSFDLAECISHECIHREQYQQNKQIRNYQSKDSTKEYLGNTGEIEAYGFSIAAESIVYNRPYYDCDMFRVYTQTFDTDQSVIVKLKKQIVKYYRELELYYDKTGPTTRE